jgi:hypothetical protein
VLPARYSGRSVAVTVGQPVSAPQDHRCAPAPRSPCFQPGHEVRFSLRSRSSGPNQTPVRTFPPAPAFAHGAEFRRLIDSAEDQLRASLPMMVLCGWRAHMRFGDHVGS